MDFPIDELALMTAAAAAAVGSSFLCGAVLPELIDPIAIVPKLVLDQTEGSTAYLRQPGQMGKRKRKPVEETELIQPTEDGGIRAWWLPPEVVMKFGLTTVKLYVPHMDDRFDLLQGRLAISTNQARYIVTHAEVSRRVNGPEILNSSHLAVNLRRQKGKHSGGYLRSQLQDLGILMTVNCRQKVDVNKVIAFTEAEAMNFANDLNKICVEAYPYEEIAEEVVSEAANRSTDIAVSKRSGDFVECVEALQNVLSSVIPPLSCVKSVYSDDVELNQDLESFSSVTHGLGIASHLIWLGQLDNIAKTIHDIHTIS